MESPAKCRQGKWLRRQQQEATTMGWLSNLFRNRGAETSGYDVRQVPSPMASTLSGLPKSKLMQFYFVGSSHGFVAKHLGLVGHHFLKKVTSAIIHVLPPIGYNILVCQPDHWPDSARCRGSPAIPAAPGNGRRVMLRFFLGSSAGMRLQRCCCTGLPS